MQRQTFIKILNFFLLTALALFCLACPAQMGDENIGEAKPHDNNFNFALWKADIPVKMAVDTEVIVPVTILNNGTQPWDSSLDKPMFLSYHWKHPGGGFDSKMFWGIKTPLPPYVGVSELVQVEMKIKTPAKAKYYDLIVDIVKGDSEIRNEVVWLEELDGRTYDIRVEVQDNE